MRKLREHPEASKSQANPSSIEGMLGSLSSIFFFFFFYSLLFFNPESCFVLLFCFESPCPSPYETWEALAEFSRECSSWGDRCSPLSCKSFDFPASQFSLGNKWTQIVFKQHSLILAFVSDGWLWVCWSRLVLPEWFCLKLKVQMGLASHWFGVHVRSIHIDYC